MRRILTTILLAAVTLLPAAAQELKPVKDKETKLFGYQDESKNWVIAPQFDNARKFHGSVAEVMVKENKNKLWGIINEDGEYVIPISCEDVSISDSQDIILANRYFQLDNPGRYTNTDLYAWGVYDLEGNEIWAPQFESKPSFNRDGHAIVKDKATRKVGIVSLDGEVVLPIENFAVSSTIKGYDVLGPSLDLYQFGSASSRNSSRTGASRFLGATPCTIPYNTDNDDLKAAAYGHRKIGIRLTANTIYSLDCEPSSRFNASLGNIVDSEGRTLDWGRYNDRFVRLELAYADEETQLSVKDKVTGAVYTVVANFYEPNGEFIECLCPEGLLYAQLDLGIAYKTCYGEYWFIADDINWPYDLRHVQLGVDKMIDWNSIEDMVGLSSSEKEDLCNFWRSGRRHTDVALADIGGLQSYSMPEEISNRETLSYQERLSNNYSFLFRRYHQGEIYQISSYSPGKSENTVKLADEAPHADVELDYSAGFTYTCNDPIFWGVKGDRYVKIVPVPKRYYVAPTFSNGVIDDRPDCKYVINFEFRLYEEDGTFVQTLGHARTIWFGDEDILGFKDMKWVFTNREPRNGTVRFITRHEPFKGNIKDFDWIQF